MFKLTRANGAFFATVPDNVIIGPNNPSGSATPINLIGRNKVSYGGAQNENYIWLTENFSNSKPPVNALKGQLWYDYSNDAKTGGGGELKISPIDNPSAKDWLTVPVIGEVNSEPTNSNVGRIIIYKKNTLKIRINNEWRTIPTQVQTSKQLQILLPIKATTEPNIIKMTKKNPYTISIFNEGGYLLEDGSIGGTSEGTLRYNSAYQYEIDILACADGDVSKNKLWRLRGSFFIKSEAAQNASGVPIADPRRIEAISATDYTTEIVYSSAGTESWTATIENNKIEPNPSDPGVVRLVGDNLGFKITGSLNHETMTDYPVRWSVSLRMTGV